MRADETTVNGVVDVEPLAITRRTLEEVVTSMVIASHADLAFGRDLVLRIKTAKDDVHEALDEHIERAHKLHRGLTSQRLKYLAPLDQLKVSVEQKMGRFLEAEEAKAAAERKRLTEIAYEKAESERLAEAERLEKLGEKEAADEVLEAPITPRAFVIASPPKTKGVVSTTRYKHRVLDPDLVPRQFCSPDNKKLRNYAQAMGSQAQANGVEFYPETQTTVRQVSA
jgi:hypothetical protein